MRVDRLLLAGILVWALAAFVPLGRAVYRAATDPRTDFLVDDDATWVIVDQPFHANPRREAGRAIFVRPFEVTHDEPVGITVHALGRWKLLLDGVVLQHGDKDTWRDGIDVALGRLPPGHHELAIDVTHASGPAAVAIAGAPLATPGGWRATLDGTTIVEVRRTVDRPLPGVSYAFPSTVEALAVRLPMIVSVAIVVLLAHLFARRRSWPEPRPRMIVGLGVGIVAVWTAGSLGLSTALGFDAEAHHDYLAFLVDRHTLPTANDGWQMFQPPLFYILAAPLFGAGRVLGGDWNVVLARLVPLLCGLGLTAILGQTLALTATTTWARHRAFIVMACLPMSLTMYRFNGNEPLAALLTAAAIWLTLTLLQGALPRATRVLALGVVAGLATLAKVSAIVVAPAVALALLSAPHGERPWRARVFDLLLVVAAFVTTCGWWFVRNQVLLGRPFVGGWDPARTVAWWQDPGYRTTADFTTFGAALSRPVFSAVISVWDGLYSSFWCDGYLSGRASIGAAPPWDWTSLIGSVPLSIPLSLLLLLGAMVGVRRRDRVVFFTIACVVAWLAAIVSLAITLPIFSTAKASYMLGIVPCFAILLAHGLDTLEKPLLRVGADVVIAVWLVLVLHGLW
jgi:hypothetical protein